MNLTLDGVVQAPGRPDEDTRGGFEYGGWAAPYGAMQSQAAQEGLEGGFGSLLMGRRTYEDFYGFWPKQKDSPFTGMLNNMPKFVASNTLKEPLEWQNTTLLNDDVVAAVNALKEQGEGNIVIMGSSNLIQTLMKHNVIDKYVLMIHPLTLGKGLRLFADGATLVNYTLASSKTAPNGIIVATYQPAA
jgi:dihydrofolate reductase